VGVSLQAPKNPSEKERPGVNVAFVIDRSESMSGRKMALARFAVSRALRKLEEHDRFVLVAYNDKASVVMSNSAATRESLKKAERRLRAIPVAGNTNLAEGWLVGCAAVGEHLHHDAVGRCLLLTDGLANVGITEPDELCDHATALRERGLSTSTFGVGADFDEALLAAIAEHGGGSFTFIEAADDIPTRVARELGETLEVVAREVRLCVRLPTQVHLEVIGPYPLLRDGERAQILLPDLVSKQLLDFPLVLHIPPGELGDELTVELVLEDREGVLGGPTQLLRFTYADNAANDQQFAKRSVVRLVARRMAAAARMLAGQRNRDGDYAGAARELQQTLRRIHSFAGSDKLLNRLVLELRQDIVEYAQPLDDVRRKRKHFASASAFCSMLAEGGRRRHDP